MKILKIMRLLPLLVLVACEPNAMAPERGDPQDTNPLRNGAMLYALANAAAIRTEGVVTVNGVKIMPGQQIGQTMHPTIDQLKAMGYVDPEYNHGGDVVLSSETPQCDKSAELSACSLVLTTTVQGRSHVEQVSSK